MQYTQCSELGSGPVSEGSCRAEVGSGCVGAGTFRKERLVVGIGVQVHAESKGGQWASECRKMHGVEVGRGTESAGM